MGLEDTLRGPAFLTGPELHEPLNRRIPEETALEVKIMPKWLATSCFGSSARQNYLLG